MNDLTMPHPAWCTLEHVPGWPIHAAIIGQIETDDGCVLVELNDQGDGRGALVTVAAFNDEFRSGDDLTTAQARELAGFLITAADVLDTAGGGQHGQ